MSDGRIVSKVEFVALDGTEGKIADLPAQVLRALFEEVTGTKEFHHSSDNRSCIVDRDDVTQLCVKMAQWVEHLHPVGAAFRFVVNYSHGPSGLPSRENVASYQKFVEHDFSSTSPVSCLEIYFSFLIPIKDSGSAAAYSVNADIHGFVLKRDESNAMNGLPDVVSTRFGITGLDLRIEYVDYLIAKNLESLVRSWFSDLPEYKVPRRPAWLPSLRSNLESVMSMSPQPDRKLIFSTFIFVSMLALAVSGDGLFWDLPLNLFVSTQGTLLVILVFAVIRVLVGLSFCHIANNSWPRGEFPMLVLNTGGQRQLERHKEILARGRGKARELFVGLLIGVIGSILASMIISIVRLF